ncbi:polysaccharide deacetylase family protein [Niallia oryzisoli]|uniref:Polysaccharide deacetylase family protein n=1 Tax=Niallia oryzisoli TaxID=1737571 RepID=A0ABZ2CM31_9BACI
MRRRRRLNTRGKIAVSVLLTIMVVLLSGLVGNDEKKAENDHDTNIEDTLEMVTFSTEPAAAFAESTLSQSIIEKENEKKEVARKKAAIKQMKKEQQENVIYLTFDDGPTTVSDELLDILDDYQMKATFFMVGPRIAEYPEVVKRMQKEGFGLGLHGMTHDVKQIYSNQSAPTEEMLESQEILEEVTGVRIELIRLPYGSFPYLTEAMRYVIDLNDFKVWDWNVDSFDWKYNNEQFVQQTIQGIEKMEKSGVTPVVLLHDTQETVKHLPKLLFYIKEQGYKTKILTNDMTPLTFSCEGRCRPVN